MQPQPPEPAPGFQPGPESGPPPARGRLTWLWIVLGAVAVLVVVCGIGAALLVPAVRTRLSANRPSASGPAAAGAAASPGNPSGADCTYPPAPGEAPDARKAPVPAAKAAVTGKVHATLVTSQGDLTLELNADDAPCTVNSFLSLTRSRYYEHTPCHRLTTSGIFVLQCGDPGGTGTGGPGYRFSDENLPTGQHPAYPRGTVAMANAGPGTNGSQFFLVYQDSDIDPNYTVFGTVSAGLDVLDKVARGGTDDSGGTGDGRPKLDVTIQSVKVN